MGKKHKKSTGVEDLAAAAEKQKEKIRHSILEVFRDRLKSSDGGGGLLVASDKVEHVEQASAVSAVHSIPSNADVAADESSSSMSDVGVQYQQRKKKKTRKGRSKSKSNSKTKVENQNKSETGKQMKMSHCTSYSLRSSGNCVTDRKVSMISQNRLTRKLGLFNQGKKSDRIGRDGIYVPEVVRKQTEEDLKKILSHNEAERQPVILDSVPHSPPPHVPNRHGHFQCLSKSDGGVSARSSSSVTPASPVKKSKPGISSASYTGGSISSIGTEDVNSIPKTPPYEEIAELLLSTLKPKDIFPNRNLLQETTISLYNMLKQNAPRSATPTPYLSDRPNSGSIRRSLLDRFHPVTESHAQDIDEKHIVHHTPPQSPEPSPTKDSSVENAGRQTDFCSLASSILTDGKGLLQQNDNVLTLTSTSTSPHVPMETDPSATDARSLLLHNDNMLSGRFKPNLCHTSGDKENYVIDMAKLQTAAKYCSISRECGTRHSSQNSQSSGYSHSQHSAGLSAHVHEDHRAGSPFNQTSVPEYMPQFHGNYYRDSLKPEEFNWQSRMTLTSQGGTMDILDYLDEGQSGHVTQHARNRTMLRAATPDSDGSPVWMAPDPLPVMEKPRLDTPTPPDFMYPRRLY